jgi:hypothetical protein
VHASGRSLLRTLPAALVAVLVLSCANATASPSQHRHGKPGASDSSAPPPTITLAAAPAHVASSRAVRLSGRVVDPLGRRLVYLQASPYPYGRAVRIASATTAADGRFSFRRFPDRNTRYRVVLAGTSVRALVQVMVAYPVELRVKALALGRVQVTIFAWHARGLRWSGARVRWRFARGYHGRYFNEPATRTREARRGLTVLSATVALPAGHFRYRACFNVPASGAQLDPGRPPGCQGRGYEGSGTVPYGFPSPRGIAAAASYLAHRAGRTAFAVVDSEGRLSGVNVDWTFVSASVVKGMLLVAYLRGLHARGQHYVDGYSDSILYPMIDVSDNNAATAVYNQLGDGGLYGLAGRAGMTDFNVHGFWANAQISAADQARFFFEMDSLIPREFVGYARRLLSTIVGYESWGIPAVARGHRYAVYFKGGWRGTALGQLVHQVARVERPDHSFARAVMTDGDPSMGYGIDTIQGLTAVLVGTR